MGRSSRSRAAGAPATPPPAMCPRVPPKPVRACFFGAEGHTPGLSAHLQAGVGPPGDPPSRSAAGAQPLLHSIRSPPPLHRGRIEANLGERSRAGWSHASLLRRPHLRQGRRRCFHDAPDGIPSGSSRNRHPNRASHLCAHLRMDRTDFSRAVPVVDPVHPDDASGASYRVALECCGVTWSAENRPMARAGARNSGC